MTVTHHLDDATIMAHAAGTLGEAHSIAVSAHLAFCPTCRAALREAETIGGEIVMQEESHPVSDNCRAATLASLDAIGAAPIQKRKGVPSEIPSVLQPVLGTHDLDQLKWKKKAPGFAVFTVPMSSSKTHLQLFRIAAGSKMPEHGHGGEELTVILRGSYSDHTGRYGRGDVADLDEDIEHQPRVDLDMDCICLVATEAPTRFKSIWARLAQPFLGI